MDKSVHVKFDMGCFLRHGDMLYRQAQMLLQHPRDCHIGTARHLQVNYSSDYHLLCRRWIL